MVKSISDIIFKTYNFKLQVLLFVDDTGTPGVNREKYGNKRFAYISQGKNSNEHPSIYFDSYGKALLGFSSTSTADGKQSIVDSIYLSQKSFYELDIAISLCVEWLKSKHYKHLFDVNSEGVVVGLGAPAPFNPTVYKNQSEFIKFFPAIVKDYNGIKYEGVSIRSHRGPLAQFTCGEFLSLAMSIKSYMVNMYGNNIMLYNTAIHLLKNHNQNQQIKSTQNI